MHGGTLEFGSGARNRQGAVNLVGLCCALGLALVGLAAPAAADAPRPNRILIEYVPPKNPAHQKIYETLKGHEVLEKLQQIFSPFKLPIDVTSENGRLRRRGQRLVPTPDHDHLL